MKRTKTIRRVTRVMLPVCAALAAAALLGVGAFGQGQNFDNVQIKTTKISNNFYTLEGQGGTIGVLAGPDGVFMVDTQFAPLTTKIVAAIRQITNAPIKFVVNTHLHGDHTGGNENLAKMGATLLARDQLRYRMAHPAPNAKGKATPAAALSAITYDGPVTLHMNGEEVQLIPIRNAHTDGDTLVRFVNNDILMPGDFFRSIQFPNIDRNSGGTLEGMIAALGQVIGLAGPSTKIIPGHGPTVDRTAVTAHRDLILALKAKVAPMVAAGQSQEQVVAANPAGEFEGKVQEAGTTKDRFVGQLYAELKAMQ